MLVPLCTICTSRTLTHGCLLTKTQRLALPTIQRELAKVPLLKYWFWFWVWHSTIMRASVSPESMDHNITHFRRSPLMIPRAALAQPITLGPPSKHSFHCPD